MLTLKQIKKLKHKKLIKAYHINSPPLQDKALKEYIQAAENYRIYKNKLIIKSNKA